MSTTRPTPLSNTSRDDGGTRVKDGAPSTHHRRAEPLRLDPVERQRRGDLGELLGRDDGDLADVPDLGADGILQLRARAGGAGQAAMGLALEAVERRVDGFDRLGGQTAPPGRGRARARRPAPRYPSA
jgi:hypothetical protein